MSIIKHFGRSYSNGSSFERATPTSRTFYFSEGSNGAAINENVIWYVDGASTNDQYPYTYSATAEFTAELRFQNGYTIASADDVTLSSDFSDPQYEWTITKSLNQSGDILTLTFTPDADDFNGSSVTIAIDENNTIVIDPTPPYAQYNADPSEVLERVYVFYKNGGLTFGQSAPITYNQLIGRQDTRMESTSSTSSRNVRMYSEVDENGYPKIGSYVKNYAGLFTTEGYDVVLTNGGNGDENVTEDGLVFKFKNVIRYELDPNGYAYVAEIIDALETTPAVAPALGSVLLELDTTMPLSVPFGATQQSGWMHAASPGENVVTFRHSMSFYLGDLRSNATEIHLSNNDGASWDVHPIDSFSGNTVTIQDTFNRIIERSERIMIKFEGDLLFPTAGPSYQEYNTISVLRSTVSGDTFMARNFRAHMAFIAEGEYSVQQLIDKKMQIVHHTTKLPYDDMIYKIDSMSYIAHPTTPSSDQIANYVSPTYIPFEPNSYALFKFPAS